MYNSRIITAGLVVFVLLAGAPFLLNIGKADEKPSPSLDTPVINKMEKKQCVESAEFMRSQHPKLLNDWRENAVREGQTVYVSSTGKKYTMSLENGCLQCHSNRGEFCDSCHTYAEVKPYCWDCHDASKGAGQSK